MNHGRVPEGTEISITCQAGFVVIGQEVITCKKSGAYSAMPTCKKFGRNSQLSFCFQVP